MNTKQEKENERLSELDEIHLTKVTGGGEESLTDEQIHNLFRTTLDEGKIYADQVANHGGVHPLNRTLGSIGRTSLAYGGLMAGQQAADAAIPNHK